MTTDIFTNAENIGSMTPLDARPMPPAPVRRCRCGTILARYNGGEQCWPCSEKAGAPLAFTRFGRPLNQVAPSQRPKPSMEDYEQVRAAIRAADGSFTTAQICPPLVSANRMSHLIVRAEKDGLVRRVGTDLGRWGAAVNVWVRAE